MTQENPMKRILAAAALIVWTAACGKSTEDQFRDGIPSADMVQLDVPSEGQSSQGLSGESTQKQGLTVTGEAGFYVLTRNATVLVNLGVVVTLGLVKAITENPPTSISGSTAVWGPHSEPLWRNSWRLTVTQTGANTYEYALDGKAKADPDTAFVTVLSGSHTVAVDVSGHRLEKYGEGSFRIDWDKAKTLPDHDLNIGTADVTYARPAIGSTTSVGVHFGGVRDWFTGKAVDGDYKYAQTSGAGGEFEFGMMKNIDVDPLRTQAERLSIKSRWMADGSGRSDVKASGGDLSANATVNECWNTSFLSTYLSLSFDVGSGHGSEATGCTFTTADYSSL
jgi:hypothetical protein